MWCIGYTLRLNILPVRLKLWIDSRSSSGRAGAGEIGVIQASAPNELCGCEEIVGCEDDLSLRPELSTSGVRVPPSPGLLLTLAAGDAISAPCGKSGKGFKPEVIAVSIGWPR